MALDRPRVRVASLALGWSMALCGTSSALEPAVFTRAQASRGQAVYAQSCAACHGTTLTGGSAPPLTGQEFQVSWSHPRVTLDDIFFVQRTTMPPRASSAVSPEDHAAVFAYLLQVNGYKAGTTPVSVGAPGLARPPRWASVGADGSKPAAAASGPPDFVEACAPENGAGTARSCPTTPTTGT